MTTPTGGQPQAQTHIYDDVDGVAAAAADLFIALAAQAGERFAVALSGGSTPRRFHAQLTASAAMARIDWQRVQFYWGDERCVPPDDPDSNYRMARETLLEHIAVRPQQVHRILGELPDHAAAAAQYEQELQAGFGLDAGELPRFDLILLGMGPDGHTASLFPHTAALHADGRLVVANFVPQQTQKERITLTAPVINNAAQVVFLIAGADKAEALAAVLEGPRDPETYPSQLIAPTQGTVHWLLDRAAAARLHSVPR